MNPPQPFSDNKLVQSFRDLHVYQQAFQSAISIETQVWLDFALRFNYIQPDPHRALVATYEHMGAQLGLMMASPEKWQPKPTKSS